MRKFLWQEKGWANELTFSGAIIPLLNEQIIKEYREVLGRKKFYLPQEVVDAVVREIERQGIFIDAEKLDIALPDKKDIVFILADIKEK